MGNITIVFMGFISQLITEGHHLLGLPPVLLSYHPFIVSDFPLKINHPAIKGYHHDELETPKYVYS